MSRYEAYLAVSVVSRALFQAQCLATGRWFSPSTLVSSTNETDRQDIAEILLKVAGQLNCFYNLLQNQKKQQQNTA